MSPLAVAHVHAMHALALVALLVTLGGVLRVAWVQRPSWAEAAGLLALTVGAIALRLAAPAGTYAQNVQTTEVFLGVDPDFWHYGVALPLLWRDALWPWLGRGYPALYALQAVVGGLVPAALVVLARTAGLGRRTSALAGVLLALTPVHLRFSHSDAHGIPETLFLVVGLTAWVRYARQPSWGAAAVGVASTWLAAVSRPEALLLVPLVGLAPVVAGVPVPWRDRRAWGAVLLLAVLVALHVAGVLAWNAPPSAHRAGLAAWPSPLVHGPRHYVGLDPTWTSPVVIAASVAGVLWGPGTWRQRLGWAALAALSGVFVLDPDWAPAGRELPTFARHQLRSLPFFAVLAAGGAMEVGRRFGRLGALVPAVVVVAAAAFLPRAYVRYTMQTELAFLLDAVAEVPDGCTLVTWYPPLDRGLILGFEASRIAGRDHRWVRLDRGDAVPTEGCVVWVRPANCAATTDQAVPGDTAPCAAFEAAHRLQPLAETRIPASPWQYERYLEDPVRVGVYRVDP